MNAKGANGPYVRLAFDDGDRVTNVDRAPDSTVWLVAR